jgi:hypothetical protein
MNRYERDYRRPRGSGRGYDHDLGGSRGDWHSGSGRGGEFRGDRSGSRQGGGYDRGYRGTGQNAGGGQFRDRQRGAAPWYPNPDRGLTEGFGDFSGRGRYGGFWGATDLRPMMADPDAEMRRLSGRGRGGRER